MKVAMSENNGISKQRGFWLRCFLSKEMVISFPNSNGKYDATQK